MSFMLLGILNAQASGGAAGAFDLLETSISNGSTNSITFSSLDTLAADYKHLQLRMTVRYQNSTDSLQRLNIKFNGSSANYANHTLRGDGTSVISSSLVSTSRIALEEALVGNGGIANVFSALVVDVLDFSSSNKNTTLRALTGTHEGTENNIALSSGLWADTSPVTSLEITTLNDNYVSGSRFSLYGVK